MPCSLSSFPPADVGALCPGDLPILEPILPRVHSMRWTAYGARHSWRKGNCLLNPRYPKLIIRLVLSWTSYGLLSPSLCCRLHVSSFTFVRHLLDSLGFLRFWTDRLFSCGLKHSLSDHDHEWRPELWSLSLVLSIDLVFLPTLFQLCAQIIVVNLRI